MTIQESGSLYNERRVPTVDSHMALRREIDSFGDKIWKGAPLVVTRHTLMRPERPELVSLRIAPESLPHNGNVSAEVLELLLESNGRSRFAHVAIDAGKEVVSQLAASLDPNKPIGPEGIVRKLRMINHGTRPVVLQEGDAPFHFYVVPDSARIVGAELEEMIGEEESKPIQPLGEEGVDWIKHYESNSDGQRMLNGLYLRIKDDERYWIPTSSEPLVLPRFSSFEHARRWLFKHYFKKTTDKKFPMPRNHIWVGKLARLKMPEGMYAELDENVFVDIGKSEFVRKGLQIRSKLLNARSEEFHVEVKGPADWALVRFVRNGGELKAG